VQAIERAKAQIIAQAYLKSLDSLVVKPTAVEIDEYFQKHPEYFTQRKQYNVQQAVIATADFSQELRAVVDSAQSIDSVVSWMDTHKVKYARGQLSRITTELPEQIAAKLKGMHKGQLFIVNEGEKTMINALISIKDSPVEESIATQQIEQYLINKKVKEKADAELARLRAAAKIEYLNASAPAATKQP
jgi:EpsD family peptidyl-prolyl cis-trans isomerase